MSSRKASLPKSPQNLRLLLWSHRGGLCTGPSPRTSPSTGHDLIKRIINIEIVLFNIKIVLFDIEIVIFNIEIVFFKIETVLFKFEIVSTNIKASINPEIGSINIEIMLILRSKLLSSVN